MSLAKAIRILRSGSRDRLCALAALMLGEMLLCVLLAGVIDRLTSGTDGVVLPLLAAGGLAATSVAAFLLLVLIAGDLVQDCDAAQEESRF